MTEQDLSYANENRRQKHDITKLADELEQFINDGKVSTGGIVIYTGEAGGHTNTYDYDFDFLDNATELSIRLAKFMLDMYKQELKDLDLKFEAIGKPKDGK